MTLLPRHLRRGGRLRIFGVEYVAAFESVQNAFILNVNGYRRNHHGVCAFGIRWKIVEECTTKDKVVMTQTTVRTVFEMVSKLDRLAVGVPASTL